MSDDVTLWREHPIHDKSFLYRILRQPFVIVPAGSHWIKPIVSHEGLGYHAQQLELAETSIAQPEAHGTYTCVEVWPTGDVNTWTAQRGGVFFAWFEKTIGKPTGRQGWAIETIARHCPNQVFNAEFIGDTCIEAHARACDELARAYKYTVPIWRRPSDGWTIPPEQSSVALPDDDEPIQGLVRRALLTTNEDPRKLHDEHCLCGA